MGEFGKNFLSTDQGNWAVVSIQTPAGPAVPAVSTVQGNSSDSVQGNSSSSIQLAEYTTANYELKSRIRDSRKVQPTQAGDSGYEEANEHTLTRIVDKCCVIRDKHGEPFMVKIGAFSSAHKPPKPSKSAHSSTSTAAIVPDLTAAVLRYTLDYLCSATCVDDHIRHAKNADSRATAMPTVPPPPASDVGDRPNMLGLNLLRTPLLLLLFLLLLLPLALLMLRLLHLLHVLHALHILHVLDILHVLHVLEGVWISLHPLISATATTYTVSSAPGMTLISRTSSCQRGQQLHGKTEKIM